MSWSPELPAQYVDQCNALVDLLLGDACMARLYEFMESRSREHGLAQAVVPLAPNCLHWNVAEVAERGGRLQAHVIDLRQQGELTPGHWQAIQEMPAAPLCFGIRIGQTLHQRREVLKAGPRTTNKFELDIGILEPPQDWREYCYVCEAQGEMHQCSCKLTYYCSAECQEEDAETHKVTCLVLSIYGKSSLDWPRYNAAIKRALCAAE